MTRHIRPLTTVVTLALLAAATSSASADVSFIGMIAVDGQAADHSNLPGLPALLEDGHSPQNALNGLGSGIAYAGNNTYYLLPDRGPNKIAYPGGATVDNTTSWAARYQSFTIQFTPLASSLSNGVYTKYTGQYTNTATTLLKNSQGAQFIGISTAFSTTPGVENRRFDPEGIRVAPDGSTWISDEYGPYIHHFNAAGQEIGSLTVPASIFNPNPQNNAALEAAATTGRVTNKGAEGLALTPDGNTLIVAMQDAIIQDNNKNSAATNSVNTRLLVYNLTQPAAAPKQYLYQLDSLSMGISEILAVNNHQLLVDERDGVAGASGIKKLYTIDLNQPAITDLTLTNESASTANNGLPVSTAPGSNIPADVVPLQKSLFADIGSILNANAAAAFTTANGLPDKIEGYAIGPDLADGRHLLLATNDNDFTQPGDSGYRPNYVFAFAVSDFAGTAIPEPASIALLAVGAASLLVRRRTRA